MAALSADEWWVLLSAIDDHTDQVRCSAVCKDWWLLYKTLPKLHIKIGINILGKKKAERFLRSSLRGRSGLQDINIDYKSYDENLKSVERAPADESNILYILKQVSGTLETLTLKTPFGTMYKKIWSRLVSDFPRLCKLCIFGGEMPGNVPLITQEHRFLQKLDLLFSDVPGSRLSELVSLCPVLETLNVGMVYGPVCMKSLSLGAIHLTHSKNYEPEEVEIDACNIKRLSLFHFGELKLGTSRSLERLSLYKMNRMTTVQQFSKLERLDFRGNDGDGSLFSRLLSCTSNLKHLIVSCMRPELRLEDVVPTRIQVLSMEGNFLGSLKADEFFRRETLDEVLELMNAAPIEVEGMPVFNLKRVAFDLRDLEDELSKLEDGTAAPYARQLALNLLSIIVQLLKCAPMLEYVVVSHCGDILGPYLLELEDSRYHLWWGFHWCWYEQDSKCSDAYFNCAGFKE